MTSLGLSVGGARFPPSGARARLMVRSMTSRRRVSSRSSASSSRAYLSSVTQARMRSAECRRGASRGSWPGGGRVGPLRAIYAARTCPWKRNGQTRRAPDVPSGIRTRVVSGPFASSEAPQHRLVAQTWPELSPSGHWRARKRTRQRIRRGTVVLPRGSSSRRHGDVRPGNRPASPRSQRFSTRLLRIRLTMRRAGQERRRVTRGHSRAE